MSDVLTKLKGWQDELLDDPPWIDVSAEDLDRIITEITRLRERVAELEELTRGYEEWVAELEELTRGYEEWVAELEGAIFDGLCNFCVPCGKCEACERVKKMFAVKEGTDE